MSHSRLKENVLVRVTVQKDHEPYVAKCCSYTASATMSPEYAAKVAAAKAFNFLLSAILFCDVSAEDVTLALIPKKSGTKEPEYTWLATFEEGI